MKRLSICSSTHVPRIGAGFLYTLHLSWSRCAHPLVKRKCENENWLRIGVNRISHVDFLKGG